MDNITLVFLTTDDLKARLQLRFLNEIAADYPNAFTTHESETIDLFKSKLGNRYNTESIFSQTGADRSKLIVKYMSDIVIYELLQNNPTRNVGDTYLLRYKAAIKWINGIRDGKETPSELPLIGNEYNLYSGNNKNADYYY